MLRRLSLSLLAATAIGVVASQGASAADMPLKAPPPVAPPPPLWNWTGLYAGGVFGLGVSRNKLSDADNGLANLESGLLDSSCFEGACSSTGARNFGTQIGVGPQGGFVLGYKWQAPNSPWVVGIDGQFSFADLQGSTNNSNSASVFFPKFTSCFKSFRTCQVNANQSTNISSKVKDIATIAALFGITSGPQDRTLWYVKGGAAYAKTNFSVSDNVNGSIVEFGVGGGIHPEDSGSVTATSFASADKSRWGWMVGTGVEFGLWGNWSAKIEYDFLDFGSYDLQLNGTASGTFQGFDICSSACSTSAGTINRTLHVDQQIHLVQVGVNYKFDWANWGR